MKANEFIKKWGVESIIERLANAPESATVISGLTCMFFKSHSEDGWSQVYMTDIGECSHTRFAPIVSPIEIKELKRLIESHELVERFDGLDSCKLGLYYLDKNNISSFEHRFVDDLSCTTIRFKQVIADVEACQ